MFCGKNQAALAQRQEHPLRSTRCALRRLSRTGRLSIQRTLEAHAEPCAQVERLAEAVEAVNPNRASLGSPLVNGKWRLLYTTSASILGTSRPPPLRPGGDIFQTIGAHARGAIPGHAVCVRAVRAVGSWC